MAENDDDTKALDDFLKHARTEMLPKMKDSALSVILHAEPDVKLCLELGAAILYDKPLIVIALRGIPVPAKLARLASAVICSDDGITPDVTERLREAITNVLKTDERVTRPI